MNTSRRHHRRPAALTLTVLAAALSWPLLSGCAESQSLQWAVNGPVLKPDAQPGRQVLLGATHDRPAPLRRVD